jgi:hypothetical protein
LAADEQPDWREIDKDGRCSTGGPGAFEAGYHLLDFHSPYLDYLCGQIREVVRLFPDCDGIFLDIILQNQSCGRWSLEFMKAHGLDPEKEPDRKESSRLALEKGDLRTGRAYARRLLLLEPKSIPAMHNLALIAIKRRRFDIARAWIARGRAVDTSDLGLRKLRTLCAVSRAAALLRLR